MSVLLLPAPKATLQRPGSTERSRVRRATRTLAIKDSFRRQILGVRDPRALLGTFDAGFSYLTSCLEDKPTIGQPRLVARAVPYVGELQEFYSQSLDTEGLLPCSDLQDLSNVVSFEDFRRRLFWNELRSIEEQELKPDNAEIFRMLCAMHPERVNIGRAEPYQFLTEHLPFLHCLRLERKDELPAYYVLHIRPRDEAEFYDDLSTGRFKSLFHYGSVIVHGLEDDIYTTMRLAEREINRKYVDRYLLLNGPDTGYTTEKTQYYLPLQPDQPDKSDELSKLRTSLDDFVRRHPGESVLGVLESFIPNLGEVLARKTSGQLWSERVKAADPVPQANDLPSSAPERWSDRHSLPEDDPRRSENAMSFLRRVYEPWLGTAGLRAHLKTLDHPLYNALGAQVSRNRIPQDLEAVFAKRYNRSKENDAELERLGITEPAQALKMVEDPKQARRLYEAARKRPRTM